MFFVTSMDVIHSLTPRRFSVAPTQPIRQPSRTPYQRCLSVLNEGFRLLLLACSPYVLACLGPSHGRPGGRFRSTLRRPQRAGHGCATLAHRVNTGDRPQAPLARTGLPPNCRRGIRHNRMRQDVLTPGLSL